MKSLYKFIGVIAMVAALSAACSKIGIPAGGSKNERGFTDLTVTLNAPETKVAGASASNEKAIQNVQVFVFRAGSGSDAGNLEVAVSAGFDSPLGVTTGTYSGITVKCSSGEREIWVVCNDSADRTQGTVSTKAEFLSLTHELVNSSASKLLMIGNVPAYTMTAGTETKAVDVKRMCAAIVLDSVTNSFISPAYQAENTFRIEDIYIINVPAQVNFGSFTTPRLASSLGTDSWYAKMGKETTPAKQALTYEAKSGEGTILNYTSVHNTTHTFYLYPNECGASENATWTTRATLLVMEASIRNSAGTWTKYYYPVTIAPDGGIRSNSMYHVTMTIKRPGSNDPNKPVTFNEVTAGISVSDWVDGGTTDKEI